MAARGTRIGLVFLTGWEGPKDNGTNVGPSVNKMPISPVGRPLHW